jgi:hypothetical protein
MPTLKVAVNGVMVNYNVGKIRKAGRILFQEIRNLHRRNVR